MRIELELPKVNEKAAKRVEELMSNIAFELDWESADKNLEEINYLTGRNFSFDDFLGVDCHDVLKSIAKCAVIPEPRNIKNITVDEIEEIINRIINGDEFTQNYYIELLNNNISCNSISDYIFFSDNYGLSGDVTNREIAEKIYEDSKISTIYL